MHHRRLYCSMLLLLVLPLLLSGCARRADMDDIRALLDDAKDALEDDAHAADGVTIKLV